MKNLSLTWTKNRRISKSAELTKERLRDEELHILFEICSTSQIGIGKRGLP